ncbi:MAG: complex I NDUFA9 subunit family protein [Rhodovibrionaceae bacterium]
MPLVTIFGGTGYLGQALVRAFLAGGWKVRIAARREPARNGGGDGLSFVAADLRDDDDVTRAVAGANCAVNAVSAYTERDGISYEGIHVDGAGRLAQACLESGVDSLVQISGIGADPASRSRYIAARGRGEARVQAAFPAAKILRPSVLFGAGGGLDAALAGILRRTPVIPLIGGGRTRLQPVHVDDVAAAALRVVERRVVSGEIYELGGPQTLSLKQCFEAVAASLDKNRHYFTLPFPLARAAALLLERLPGAPLTLAQVELLMKDNFADPSLPGLKDLGIAPKALT